MRKFKRFNSSLRYERMLALENARMLTKRILRRRKGKPLDLSQVVEYIREERINELVETH